MVISQRKSPETILREALVVARDELKRVNDHYSCVRPDPFGVVLDALNKVPAIPPIEHASEVERRIVGKVVQDILAAGNTITVNDGEDETLVCSIDAEAIFKALASTDEDYVIVNSNQNGRYGWVRLIWGNDCDIISDYTTNLETLLAGANAFADELEG